MDPRLFIAFPIPFGENLQHSFTGLQQHFRFDKMNWANPKQLHVTLKFIGETPASNIQALQDAMMEAFAAEQKCIISLKSLGVFGSSYAPKVLWTKVEPADRLQHWFDLLKKALMARGFEYDRQNFVPHLTLARIRAIQDKDLLRRTVSQYQQVVFTETGVSKIVLYQSILKPTGAEYRELFTMSLH